MYFFLCSQYLLNEITLLFFFSQMNFKYPIQKQPLEVFYKKNSQNSQENICARVSFFIKLQTLKGHTYLKKPAVESCSFV